MSAATSTWVRIAVTPLATSIRAARSARSAMSSRVSDGRWARHATMAPRRSPVGFGDALGGERLVEVGVRLGGGRQQHVAGEVDARLADGRASRRGADRGDQLALDADVGPRAVGQRGALQQHQARRREGPRRPSARPRRGTPPRRRGASARSSPRGSGPGSRRRSRGAPGRAGRARSRCASTTSSIEPIDLDLLLVATPRRWAGSRTAP